MNDEAFKSYAVIFGLSKMFRGGHFDILAVKGAWEAMGVEEENGMYKTLSPLHCVDWEEMPGDFSWTLKRKVVESMGFDSLAATMLLEEFEPKPEPQPKVKCGFWTRLFGGCPGHELKPKEETCSTES